VISHERCSFLRDRVGDVGIKGARKESLFWWRNAWRRMRARTPRTVLLSVVFEPIQVSVIPAAPGLSLFPRLGSFLVRWHFAANPVTPFGVYSFEPQSFLRALRLTILFSALASTSCLAEDPNNAAAASEGSVSMDHSTFIPGEITVVPGTTVTWVNNETMPHTVVDSNKAFRSKTLAKDGRFSFTFTTTGDYSYVCSIHPNMKGKIIVKPAAS
jgi:plastocyanin